MAIKWLLYIPQSSSITGISPSDRLVSYPGHSLGESYASAEMLLVYSTAPNRLGLVILLVNLILNKMKAATIFTGYLFLPETIPTAAVLIFEFLSFCWSANTNVIMYGSP